MPARMKILVEKCIEECEEAIKNNNESVSKELQEKVLATFENYISKLDNGLSYDMPDINGGEYWLRANYAENIKKLKYKLEGFLASNCQDMILNNSNAGTNVVLKNENINTNTNTNINTINIETIIEKARKDIEANESISEEEIKEVLEKIDKIEEISKSNEAKNKKWFKLRPTLQWLGTKGVTVGTTILNLITAILKFQS
ncbi:hypothetical protein FDB23_03245 [Clostridium botulinum]|nr:hypothetical protein [Clostridium botulinum]